MAYLVGDKGMVNGASMVRAWEIRPTSPGGPYVSSATKGAVDRIYGYKDWTGRYDAFGHTPAVLPGENFTFSGSIDGTNGVTGPAIVEAVRISIEIPQEEESPPVPIGHTVVFKANGELTSGAVAISDNTVAEPPNPKNLKVMFGSSQICSAFQANITIAARNPLYRPGCNSGQTYRLKGNIDAAAEIALYEANYGSIPAVGTADVLKIYVDSTLFWEFQWMLVEDFAPFQVPIHDIIKAVVKFTFKSVKDTSRGKISKPGGTQWWPSIGT